LFKQVGRDARIQDRFIKPGARSEVDQEAVKRYIGRIIEFQEKLTVLIHITRGQPARGLKILSVQHSNTSKGGHRNIFIEDSIVVFITQYHKGYNISGNVKIIH
jgi:hypothetical protein